MNDRTQRRWRMLAAAGLLAAMQIGMALAARRLSPAEAMTWSTVLALLGTFGIAVLLDPVTPYSKAAHWMQASVFAAVIVASATLAANPTAWLQNARAMLWLLPWYQLTVASLPGTKTKGWCSPRARYASWLLVWVSAVLGTFVMLEPFAMR